MPPRALGWTLAQTTIDSMVWTEFGEGISLLREENLRDHDQSFAYRRRPRVVEYGFYYSVFNNLDMILPSQFPPSLGTIRALLELSSR